MMNFNFDFNDMFDDRMQRQMGDVRKYGWE